jgi:hypothetical protein
VYRIVTDSAVLDQLAVLPTEALPGYAEVLDVLELAPWNGRPYNKDKPDVPMRELVFGAHGEGTVTYLVLERERAVHVLVVHWVG